jgi:glycosyltransferase involved in cell wall biosynthesis
MTKIKVLLEMRPSLEGFAGIPQEVRLLFHGLRQIESIEVEGMLQTSHRRLAKGLPIKKPWYKKADTSANRYRKLSNVIISMAEKPYQNVVDIVSDWTLKKTDSFFLYFGLFTNSFQVRMSKFESAGFEDFTWRTFFAKTIPVSDIDLVAKANHRVIRISWHLMHMVGLGSLNWSKTPLYPVLDTSGVNIFIGQTPYPARVSKDTKLVIRYHDAIPIFMPHTIADKSTHQATHFYALMSNVESGAWFSCVSEATKQDLQRLFPQVVDRAVVIHNMVSHHYYDENSNYDLVPGIIRSRFFGLDPEAKDVGLDIKFLTLREQENFFKKNLPTKADRYILVVSTIEPRKNHIRLLAAWEVLIAEVDPSVKLVVVGTLGWDYKPIQKGFKTWIDRGQLFMLNSVPAPNLRVLYRHAAVTVCPSLGEGFDFSGVESMASGGITIASDIPVHREIYDDAAEYFDPYSTMSLVNALKKVLYESNASSVQMLMRQRGKDVAARYKPEQILPKWEKFLNQILISK